MIAFNRENRFEQAEAEAWESCAGEVVILHEGLPRVKYRYRALVAVPPSAGDQASHGMWPTYIPGAQFYGLTKVD